MAKKIMEKNLNARMMHLAGVTTLNEIKKTIDPKLIVARILPMVSSVKKCLKIGIPSDNVIAMQGTFSKEFNRALMREYAIGVVVTKESGEIPLIIVKRPIIREMENESVFKDIDHLLKYIVSLFEN
jgi:precorrin-6A/cobalt-precorrin-6A reductase